jgi:hypothetical protein
MAREEKILVAVAPVFKGGGGGKIDLSGSKEAVEFRRHPGINLTAKSALPQGVKERDAIGVGNMTDTQGHQLTITIVGLSLSPNMS